MGTQNFDVLFHEPFSYHFCLMKRWSIMLERHLYVTKCHHRGGNPKHEWSRDALPLAWHRKSDHMFKKGCKNLHTQKQLLLNGVFSPYNWALTCKHLQAVESVLLAWVYQVTCVVIKSVWCLLPLWIELGKGEEAVSADGTAHESSSSEMYFYIVGQ